MDYLPLALPFFAGLFLLFVLVVLLIELRIVQFAYERVGIGPRYMLALLLLSFLGSYVNITVAHLPPERVYSNEVISFFGMRYVIPVVHDWPGTVIAVNVGGAVVPTLVSVYLILKNRLYLNGLIAVAIVTLVVHWMAHPVPGVGIAVPIFVPPLIAALVGLVLSPRRAAPLAYVAGSLGTLIGADLLNLDKVRGLGAPVASIGGAGKFDGIFLTGLIGVLLASLVSGQRRG
ncbi:MAG: DUF1614 domain-containing protein [Betaproteobacteria bacterium]|nr:DUF1614 domain-containing protein [Betaproteobacteria bacterium]